MSIFEAVSDVPSILYGVVVVALGAVLFFTATFMARRGTASWRKPVAVLGVGIAMVGYVIFASGLLTTEGVTQVYGALMLVGLLVALVGYDFRLRRATIKAAANEEVDESPIPFNIYVLRNATPSGQLADIVAPDVSGTSKIAGIVNLLQAVGATRISVWPEGRQCFVQCAFPDHSSLVWMQAALRKNWGVEMVVWK